MTVAYTKEMLLHLQAKSEAFAAEHSKALAKEILDWHATGILVDGKLRELARLWHPVDINGALGIAESYAKVAILNALLKT